MAHTVTFFPGGNADTCLIELNNGRCIVYDYANTRDPDDDDDKRINLEEEIRDRLQSDTVDVLAFSHLDRDHYTGASNLFWLEHAEKYQSEDRIKISVLWVPAAAILEVGITDEGKTLRAEARHRLKAGSGIRVFSSPNLLDDFLRDNDIEPSSRSHLITDAGELAPEFELTPDGIEFFVHSPFAKRCDDGTMEARNETALFMQATFDVEGAASHLILSADCVHEVLEEIVEVSRAKGNEQRLVADINNVPHHCSYLSLSADKGTSVTEPSEALRWFYENQSSEGCIFVSTSDCIPTSETTQPPHYQAAAYYKSTAEAVSGEFIVTMEHPDRSAPQPLVIEITRLGPKRKKEIVAVASVITSSRAPRAGCC